MKNQINLMPDIFTPIFDQKTKRIYLAIVMASILASLSWGGFDYYQYWQLEQKYVAAQKKKNDIVLALENLTSSQPKGLDFKTLEHKYNQNSAEIKQKGALLFILRDNNFQSDHGFSALLSLLSERKSEQMQLTNIQITQTATHPHLVLQGVALQADSVPNYILSLERSLLDKLNFNHMEVKHRSRLNNNEKLDVYDFVISTQGVKK